MQNFKKTALALVLGLAATNLFAAAEKDVQVKLKVANQCSFEDTSNFIFPDQAAGNLAANIDHTFSIKIKCSTGTAYKIGANDGLNPNSGNRRLKQGTSNFVNYNLYKDNYQNILRNTTDINKIVETALDDQEITVPIYARIFSNQNLVVGDYQDTVKIYMTF